MGHYALFLDFLKGNALSELFVVLFELNFYTSKLLLIFARVVERPRRRPKFQ